ncbi:MAG: hypothetical protein K8R90_07030 [Candidatus Cloacimonetes bacterium]|nr:hypothetical protein [Candidatus Cloacimonadota bacterium]
MRKAVLLLAITITMTAMYAEEMTMEELGEAICSAFAGQDFASLRPLLLDADDVARFLNQTTLSEEYIRMSPEERYLVDAWLAEAKHTTRQEFEFQLYKLQQQFEKLLSKGSDMYGIDWADIAFESIDYADEIESGIQRIRHDVRVIFSWNNRRYAILLAGATYARDGWKLQYESLRLIRM